MYIYIYIYVYVYCLNRTLLFRRVAQTLEDLAKTSEEPRLLAYIRAMAGGRL